MWVVKLGTITNPLSQVNIILPTIPAPSIWREECEGHAVFGAGVPSQGITQGTF